MNEHEQLAEQFEIHRSHLQGVAYRILGSLTEADDAVQAAWLRLSRADASSIENMGGWLTTVVARVCLDMLRTRKSRRENSLDAQDIHSREPVADPEHEALLVDSVGLALLLVLDTLTPDERLAFVLHDIFDVPFDEIGPIVGRTSEATRQLASRARRRVRGPAQVSSTDLVTQREIVTAFLTASRTGDFDALLTLLDPNVVYRTDSAAASAGTEEELFGAAAVARQFAGRARGALAALVDGAVGVVVARENKLFLALNFTVVNGKITEINAIADPTHLSRLSLSVLED